MRRSSFVLEIHMSYDDGVDFNSRKEARWK